MPFFTAARALRIGALPGEFVSLPPAIEHLHLGGWPKPRDGSPPFLRILLAFAGDRARDAVPLQVTIDRREVLRSIKVQERSRLVEDETDEATAASLDVLAAEGRKLVCKGSFADMIGQINGTIGALAAGEEEQP